MLRNHSISQVTSSSRSGMPLAFSAAGNAMLPSANASVPFPRNLKRSYWLSSVQIEIPPFTTYLPWSPASYQPPYELTVVQSSAVLSVKQLNV